MHTALTAELIPIIVLVYLNFASYIIGASAWCPRGNCFIDFNNAQSGIPAANLERFNHELWNMLGALQLVAKALEVWFALIAGALIFAVMMWLAGGEAGLPLQFVTIPYEDGDPSMLWRGSFWRAYVPALQDHRKPKVIGEPSTPLLPRRRTGDGYSKHLNKDSNDASQLAGGQSGKASSTAIQDNPP